MYCGLLNQTSRTSLLLPSVSVNKLSNRAFVAKLPPMESTVQACALTPLKLSGRVPTVTVQTLLVVEPALSVAMT